MLAVRHLRVFKFRFRRAASNAKPTFFLHIPKCAGTSVWETLIDIYGTRHVFIANSKARRLKLAAMVPEARRWYSAIGGHSSLRFYREQLGEMAQYHKIVTLRDPIDRSISEYNYIRAETNHPRHEAVSKQSLAEFAAVTLPPNRQVKLLSDRVDDVEGALNVVTRYFDDWALSNGVDDLIRLLYEVTDTKRRATHHKNKGAPGVTRADLDPRTLRALEERNRHDLELIEALRRIRGQ